MGRLEERLRRLEEQLVSQPSFDEYLAARHGEQVRALHKVVSYSANYDLGKSCLFTEADRRMLAEDTPGRREKDWETIESWQRAQGRDLAAETEGAKEKLLAKLQARE